MTREGGSIPVTLSMQEATGKNVMLLPMGSCDDGAHSQNEKLNRSNYISGVCCLFITSAGYVVYLETSYLCPYKRLTAKGIVVSPICPLTSFLSMRVIS